MSEWKLLDYNEEPPEGMEWEMLCCPVGTEPRRWKSVASAPERKIEECEIYRYRPVKTDADKCWEAFGVGLYSGSRKKGKYSFDRTMFNEVAGHVRKWDKEQR